MSRNFLLFTLCPFFILSLSCSNRSEVSSFDLVIVNGWIVDGTGNPSFKADVGVKDGKIARIGNLADTKSKKSINASGLIVSPGFIDLHNHSDEQLLENPKADSYIRQGVTTLFIGQCGATAVPSDDYPTFDKYFSKLENQGIAPNVAAPIGHGQIRSYVIGEDDRKPTPEELERMKAIVVEAMEDGAFGITTGLVYAPGTFADTDEIIELCKVVAEYDGLYATHVRNDGAKWEEAILEAIETAEKSGVRLQISHNESHYPNWGKLDKIMRHIENARERGLRVSCDVIPMLCGNQSIDTIFPNWALSGGTSKLLERLKNPEEREKIKKFILEEKEQHTNPSSTLLADGYAHKIRIEGTNLAEIAKKRHQNPVDAAMDMIIEKGETFGVIMEFHDEDDICELIKHPLSSIVSDGFIQTFGEGVPHPRSYSCFPLIFRKYVRGETRPEEPNEVGRKILFLQEAVRKITSCPAQQLRLKDRGLLREGMCADITIFDPLTISDQSTYADPHRYPKGIPFVIVNGKLVVENSEHTGALPGRVLRANQDSK